MKFDSAYHNLRKINTVASANYFNTTSPFRNREVLDSAYHIPHTYAMRITISLPDHLASRFFALVSSHERSATIARLLEQELAQREHALEQACLAANADAA